MCHGRSRARDVVGEGLSTFTGYAPEGGDIPEEGKFPFCFFRRGGGEKVPGGRYFFDREGGYFAAAAAGEVSPCGASDFANGKRGFAPSGATSFARGGKGGKAPLRGRGVSSTLPLLSRFARHLPLIGGVGPLPLRTPAPQRPIRGTAVPLLDVPPGAGENFEVLPLFCAVPAPYLRGTTKPGMADESGAGGNLTCLWVAARCRCAC